MTIEEVGGRGGGETDGRQVTMRFVWRGKTVMPPWRPTVSKRWVETEKDDTGSVRRSSRQRRTT
jgi:hypothetical protein